MMQALIAEVDILFLIVAQAQGYTNLVVHVGASTCCVKVGHIIAIFAAALCRKLLKCYWIVPLSACYYPFWSV